VLIFEIFQCFPQFTLTQQLLAACEGDYAFFGQWTGKIIISALAGFVATFEIETRDQVHTQGSEETGAEESSFRGQNQRSERQLRIPFVCDVCCSAGCRVRRASKQHLCERRGSSGHEPQSNHLSLLDPGIAFVILAKTRAVPVGTSSTTNQLTSAVGLCA
jgi:hypothetical protein